MNEKNNKPKRCCLCEGDIEQKFTAEGKMYWDKGNNAQPLAEGRCCDECNYTKVIPARLKGHV